MEETAGLPHSLRLEERSKLVVTGAKEVLRFSEEQVEVVTCAGDLTVAGEGLRLRCLSLEDGRLIIQGTICAIVYGEPPRRRRFLR